jgi:prepilin peptidase CpaA
MVGAPPTDLDLDIAPLLGTCTLTHRELGLRPRHARLSRPHRADAFRLMAFRFDLFPLAGFAALMIAAAVADFRRLVIPNGIVVALCILWPLHVGSARGASLGTALESVAAAMAVLAAGAFLFARGLVGGGDVKLLAAASLWVGAAAVPALMTATAVIGGVLAVAFLSPIGRFGGAGRLGGEISHATAALVRIRQPLPYGIAISSAALIVTIAPCFG